MDIKTNSIRCENGHFYDANKYISCPHCAKERGEKIESTLKPVENDSSWKCTKCGKLNFGKFCVECGAKKEESVEPEPPEKSIDEFGPVESPKEEEKIQSSVEEESIRNTLKPEAVYNDPVTLGRFAMKLSSSSNNNGTEYVIQSEPVVGWIVCIEGNEFGKPFQIVSGKNSIGRHKENSIVINDKSVSREKHAFIIYEPKKRNFYVQPGEGSQLTYLNDENIMEAKPLKKNDIIEIGSGKYIFIPLCSEEFSWEDYIK